MAIPAGSSPLAVVAVNITCCAQGVSADGTRAAVARLDLPVWSPDVRPCSIVARLKFGSESIKEFPLLEDEHQISRRHRGYDEEIQSQVIDEQNASINPIPALRYWDDELLHRYRPAASCPFAAVTTPGFLPEQTGNSFSAR
jgi:hypothetical protein